jgi:Cu/Ag efflux protein CusF
MNGMRTLPAALILLTTSISGCSAPEKAAPPAAALADRYEVRGEVVRLPAAGSRELFIKHEAVPGFKDESGKVVGMEGMAMPFAVAEGVALEGLAPGDAITFTLEVAWKDSRNPVRIVRIEKQTLIHKMDLESGALPPAQGNETPR